MLIVPPYCFLTQFFYNIKSPSITDVPNAHEDSILPEVWQCISHKFTKRSQISKHDSLSMPSSACPTATNALTYALSHPAGSRTHCQAEIHSKSKSTVWRVSQKTT